MSVLHGTYRCVSECVISVYLLLLCALTIIVRCQVSMSGSLVGKSAGLVIERLQVRILSGAAGEFSSPGLTLCADSYSVSVPPPCYRRGTKKTSVILPKVQVAGYI